MILDSLLPLLKPGVMYRQDDLRADLIHLYQPTLALNGRFSSGDDSPLSLTLDDLRQETSFWDQGMFQFDRYYFAHSFRRHQTHREANLEINYHCHYGCQHCFQSLLPTTNESGSPSWDQLVDAVHRLVDAGACEISITGGDIFLQPHLWKLLEYLDLHWPQLTVRLLVNAGALNLQAELSRQRLKSLCGKRVILKSDFFGHNADLHDEFTRFPGSYEKLVLLFEFAAEIGITAVATGALTRENFATRFELVNFLHNLTQNRFTISSIIFPSLFRADADQQELRVTVDQYEELLEEQFFFPLTSEYHSWEPQCDSDCQVSMVSANGDACGCSFLKLPAGDDGGSQALPQVHASWLARARHAATVSQCAGCSAETTCRRCPSHLTHQDYTDAYCRYSRLASAHVNQRVSQAKSDGFQFAHSVPSLSSQIM